MLFGMPASDFLAFAVWPVGWIIATILVYRHLKKIEAFEKEAESNQRGG